MEERLTAFIDSINRKNISALCYDSRRASEGSLFFALPGIHSDGKLFISDAVRRGAKTVVYEGELDNFHPGTTYIRVTNCREAMSAFSSAFFDRPSESMYTIGVTGTDGKSTTVFFIYQLLRACGLPAGYLSTVRFNTGAGTTSNNYLRQSTPEAPEIQGLLAEMRENGVEYAVLEATSHGLSPKTQRLRDVHFSAGVLTNISHEHLEFHGSFEQYRRDKANLFKNVRSAVINADDPQANYFIETAARAGSDILTYSLLPSGEGDFNVLSYRQLPEALHCTFAYRGRQFSVRLPFIGSFNLENYAAAFLAAREAGDCPPDMLAEAAGGLEPVPGRMNIIAKGQPFTVIVDYAHTPGSFSKVLPLLRGQTEKRLIAVFGSAGERDPGKRPKQGAVADTYCDIIVLTDEDPRGEDPGAILREIAAGCGGKSEGDNLLLIPDRREAIRKAFSLAGPGDTVLLLGKGHEKSIIYNDGPVPWDETAAAEALLTELF